MARSIGALAAKGVDLRVKGGVELAKAVARPSLQAFGGAQDHFAFNRQISRRRAKQIGRIDRHLCYSAQRQRRLF